MGDTRCAAGCKMGLLPDGEECGACGGTGVARHGMPESQPPADRRPAFVPCGFDDCTHPDCGCEERVRRYGRPSSLEGEGAVTAWACCGNRTRDGHKPTCSKSRGFGKAAR